MSDNNKSRWRKNIAKKEVSTSSSSSTCSWSSDGNNDPMTLKAIKDYLSNRTELAHELFKSVKPGKVRLMLPQVLKKMNMTELEELCASELCGMSKYRILSILNGTPMTNSSDTCESGDSGPSLEIISDTEAWISDNDQQNCSSSFNKSKLIKKAKLQMDHDDTTTIISKSCGKMQSCDVNESHLIKVKKEKEKEQVGNQEGESLLDLLELEMRARAIKALIRKEEDIVSTFECGQKITSNFNVLKVDVPTTMTNYDILHKNSIIDPSFHENTIKNGNAAESMQMMDASLKSMNVDEDQDVVMLINPTPTVNLLSSDSESDDLNIQSNKRCERKCLSNKFGNRVIKCEHKLTIEKSAQPLMKVTNCNNSKYNNDESTNGSFNIENIDDNVRVPISDNANHDSGGNNNCQMDNTDTFKFNIDHPTIKSESEQDKALIFRGENKLIDDEIIDLDDYPEDMDDIENYEDISSRDKKSIEKNNTVANNTCEKSATIPLNLSETWATRYYQTDNVQNVIKESKIQSEIRKRLRERQKLSKLNTCAKNVKISCPDNNKQTEQLNNRLKLTGSVQEYLALEGTISASRVINSLKQSDRHLDVDDNIS